MMRLAEKLGDVGGERGHEIGDQLRARRPLEHPHVSVQIVAARARHTLADPGEDHVAVVGAQNDARLPVDDAGDAGAQVLVVGSGAQGGDRGHVGRVRG